MVHMHTFEVSLPQVLTCQKQRALVKDGNLKGEEERGWVKVKTGKGGGGAGYEGLAVRTAVNRVQIHFISIQVAAHQFNSLVFIYIGLPGPPL